MAKLSGPEIQRQIGLGNIVIMPFDARQVNSNSYNVRLGKWIKVLKGQLVKDPEAVGYGRIVLDLHRKPEFERFKIGREGLLIEKGKVYLGHTIERIHGKGYVPCVDGRSTGGRFGVTIHETAGFGDDGFKGTFTLEIRADHLDTIIYPGDLIAQVSFDTLVGERMPYCGGYQGQDEPREPKALEMWEGLDDYLKEE